MKKLYPLIFISIFPLITTAQLSNIPDSLTELSVDELTDMRSHKHDTVSLKPNVGILSAKEIKNDENTMDCPPSKMSVIWPLGYWKTDYLLNTTPIIREEDYDENK